MQMLLTILKELGGSLKPHRQKKNWHVIKLPREQMLAAGRIRQAFYAMHQYDIEFKVTEKYILLPYKKDLMTYALSCQIAAIDTQAKQKSKKEEKSQSEKAKALEAGLETLAKEQAKEEPETEESKEINLTIAKTMGGVSKSL
jgi:hypothetical protein